MANDYEVLKSSPEFLRTLRQEELILEVTEVLSKAMEDSGVRKADLATRLNKSRGFVSQLLSGGQNLTLRTISDVSLALGVRPSLKLCSDAEWGRYAISVSLQNWGHSNILKFPPVRLGGCAPSFAAADSAIEDEKAERIAG